MSPAVFGADEQSDREVEIGRWVALAEAVLEAEGVGAEVELSLLFVDEGTMAELNSRFLGREGPTDVLAFPMDEEPVDSGRSPDAGGTGPGSMPDDDEGPPILLGDVVICPQVAWRNLAERPAAPEPGAPEAGAPEPAAAAFEDEVALLVVHGILHLQGMDHEEEDEAQAMEAREQELLERFHRSGRPPEAGPGGRPAGEAGAPQ